MTHDHHHDDEATTPAAVLRTIDAAVDAGLLPDRLAERIRAARAHHAADVVAGGSET